MSAFFRYFASLCLALVLPYAQAQSVPSQVLFDDPPPAEGGWKGLAHLLEAMEPGTDTALPLSPSQISERISDMLNDGQSAEALKVIEKYENIRGASPEALGTDVQLMFQKGRALSAIGRNDEAIALYRDMTVRFPELPEPWNNLAAEYVKKNQLDLARDALLMSLSISPSYAAARINLGRVYLMLARESFSLAVDQGQPQARDTVTRIDAILQPR
ncbi:hypothetical protein H0484_12130 [Pusillimonas sp. CC-YST705]|uniref:Tetratricopeptide repeat protein n=1 Tax=Mesopusillimonas faecipullorum TaxID=2755040 RepID=A0ABS8CEQ2_9BURK|nr:hypothetical protein [Mesopusillimonas faecipullorum]MCB5364493.1 hypothetical protein [Mesopusillimonas faecipullorum]